MATVVVWPRGDQVAFDLIIAAYPDYDRVIVYYGDPHYLKETLVDKNGAELPIEPEPALIADNDLILIGGDQPNPYVKKYFWDTGLIKYDPTTKTISGQGVYANGTRAVALTTRPNGTKVIAIFGYRAIDTLYAMEDYLRIGPVRETVSRFRGAVRGIATIPKG